jgi:hypothetical protein
MIQHELKHAAVKSDVHFETGLCWTVRFIFILHEHCTQWDDSEQDC